MLLISCVLLLASLSATAQQEGGGIRITEKTHDFGTIREQDGVVSHTFTYINTGTTPVAIAQALSGCSCVKIECDRAPVLAGKSGKFTVRFDPALRPGFFSKEINLLTAPDKAHLRVWIKGSVVGKNVPLAADYPYDFGRGLKSNRENLLLGSVRQGQHHTIALRCANTGATPMQLRFDVEGDDPTAVDLADVTLAAASYAEISVGYTMPSDALGSRRVTIRPVVNGVRSDKCWHLSVVGIPSVADSSQHPSSAYGILNFSGETASGKAIRYATSIRNVGDAPLRILSVDCTPGITVSLEKGAVVRPGETRNFSLVFDPKGLLPGRYTGEVIVVTNEPYKPYVTIQLNTTVK